MVSVDHLDEIDHATEGVRSFSPTRLLKSTETEGVP